MRKIDKGAPLESFSEFVKTHPQARWEEAKDVSHIWREYMLHCEQHGMSGYTEEPLRLNHSHIDHFHKRSLFSELIFDWNNFVVDGVDETYGAKFKDKHVKNREDNDMLINPVVEDAGRFFKYEQKSSGESTQTHEELDVNQSSADEGYTIKAFNLNEASLSERRKTIINIVLDTFENLSDESILEALEAEGFRSVVEQLLDERKQGEDSK